MRHDKSVSKENDVSLALKATLFGAAIGAVVCAAFLFLFAFLFVAVKSIPQPMIQWLAILCAALGALAAGYAATRIYGSKGLMFGASAAMVLFVVLTLIAFIISRDKFTYITLIRLLAMTLSGAIGGILAANKKKRK